MILSEKQIDEIVEHCKSSNDCHGCFYEDRVYDKYGCQVEDYDCSVDFENDLIETAKHLYKKLHKENAKKLYKCIKPRRDRKYTNSITRETIRKNRTEREKRLLPKSMDGYLEDK